MFLTKILTFGKTDKDTAKIKQWHFSSEKHNWNCKSRFYKVVQLYKMC